MGWVHKPVADKCVGFVATVEYTVDILWTLVAIWTKSSHRISLLPGRQVQSEPQVETVLHPHPNPV